MDRKGKWGKMLHVLILLSHGSSLSCFKVILHVSHNQDENSQDKVREIPQDKIYKIFNASSSWEKETYKNGWFHSQDTSSPTFYIYTWLSYVQYTVLSCFGNSNSLSYSLQQLVVNRFWRYSVKYSKSCLCRMFFVSGSCT